MKVLSITFTIEAFMNINNWLRVIVNIVKTIIVNVYDSMFSLRT